MQQRPALTPEFQVGEIKDVGVRELHKFDDRRGWLTELFRHDDLAAEFFPAMAYISSTRRGVARGPHEHVDQADFFCFLRTFEFQTSHVGQPAGIVINCPNRLYMGEHRREPIDEIRHEGDPETIFRMDDQDESTVDPTR
jgi:dTDP-4-dehydrorhamnose 3,5-epimerase